MANRVPLVVANQKIREIADGDTLDLTGNAMIVGGHLTPSADSTYDLGDSSKKWKDLYLSGSTIHLGNILLQDSGGQLITRDSASGPITTLGFSANTTDDLTEGSSNLYFSNKTTDNLTEGTTNLYYTNARADARVDAKLASNVTIGGNAIITGNLTVSGTETIINSTTLSVNDKTIVLADSAADSSAANGAGIEVFAAGAKITYDHANAEWDLNRKANIRGTEIDDGGIAVKTSTGSVAYIDLYCESGNAHRTRLKAPTHSQYSGNLDVIVPNESGTIATVGNDSADTLLIKNSGGTTVKTVKGVGNSAL